MPLVLAPSFDDHTREQVEAHIDQVRLRRIAGALEYQQSRMLKLENYDHQITDKLARTYEKLGKSLMRLDRELEKVEEYTQTCQMLMTEVGLTHDRIELAKRK
jgi:putative alpha-1,2-mannosidase